MGKATEIHMSMNYGLPEGLPVYIILHPENI